MYDLLLQSTICLDAGFCDYKPVDSSQWLSVDWTWIMNVAAGSLIGLAIGQGLLWFVFKPLIDRWFSYGD